LWKLWLLIDKTSSMYLNVWLKDTASFLSLSRNSFWTNSASYEYNNKSANKGAQSVNESLMSRRLQDMIASHIYVNGKSQVSEKKDQGQVEM
jgi:hypothetical protein